MQKIFKAIVKAGLKAMVPLVGDLAVDLAQAGTEQFLDARETTRANDIAGRLLARLQVDVSAWQVAEHMDGGALERAMVMAEQIASRSQSFLARWADADFDANRAALEAVSAAEKASAQLDDVERGACVIVLNALFDGLASERLALQATEARFRGQVLGGMASLAKQVQHLPAAHGEWLLRMAASAALSLPVQRWAPDMSAPAALLRADLDDPVPFHGRSAELQDLEDWCTRGAALRVRVYAGRGGIGKTRLLRELSRRMWRGEWRAGFLDPGLGNPAAEFWPTLVAGAEPCLFIIDYAETRREQVIALVSALVRLLDQAGHAKRRVVLIARAADEWWDQLRGEGLGVGDVLRGPLGSVHKLGPVADTQDERQLSFRVAAEHFARKLLQPTPRTPDATEFGAEEFETTLLLHIAALAAVEGVPVKGDQGILDYILDRERRFWRDRAATVGLGEPLVRGFGRVMAATTLIGGLDSRSHAVELLGRIAFFADQPVAVREQVAQLLHETYPGDRWIEPMLPDLLGEHLCQQELRDETVGREIDDLVFGPGLGTARLA